MTIWFTSDTHFSHYAILKHCNRPFRNIREMNDCMITNWNERVKSKDLVYHLGDFGFGSPKYLASIIKQLKGKLYFIRGNHDKAIKKEVLECPNFYYLGNYLDLIIPNPKIKNKQLIVLCHYPFETWNRKLYGSLNIHGHCHGTLKRITPNRLDAGVDCHNFAPINLEECAKLLKLREYP